MKQGLVRLLYNFCKRFMGWTLHMIMCVLLCYPVSIHMSQLLSTGHPISSFLSTLDFQYKYSHGHLEVKMRVFSSQLTYCSVTSDQLDTLINSFSCTIFYISPVNWKWISSLFFLLQLCICFCVISIWRQIHGKSHSLTDWAVVPHCVLCVNICVLHSERLIRDIKMY